MKHATWVGLEGALSMQGRGAKFDVGQCVDAIDGTYRGVVLPGSRAELFLLAMVYNDGSPTLAVPGSHLVAIDEGGAGCLDCPFWLNARCNL